MTDADANRRLESRYQGNVFYRARTWDRRSRQSPRFPIPHIRPRQRRPQSIHVVSYPPGYIPSELRLESAIRPRRQPQSKKRKGKGKSGEPVGNQAKGCAWYPEAEYGRRIDDTAAPNFDVRSSFARDFGFASQLNDAGIEEAPDAERSIGQFA
ncbi:hypothetical protein DL770_000802 [Monosporascus sp. CRB-9-2]|nr:hypothetical protein DL770_000802 [Monosporascus sp. CRB-9-2]